MKELIQTADDQGTNRMPSPHRIFLVDDHPIVRQGLARLISQERDLEVCGEADQQYEALRRIMDERPDLVVVDLSLASGDGVDLIKSLGEQLPHLPILVLTMHTESFFAERALRAGARGYLTKGDASESVVKAIRQLLAGEIYVCERVAPTLMKKLISGASEGEDPVARLSDRELQVFRLIGQGRGTQEIADEIHLSVKTIETYRANIKRKLDLKDARKLTEYAIRWNVAHGG